MLSKSKKFIIVGLFAMIFSGVLFCAVSETQAAKIGDYSGPLGKVVEISGVTGSGIPQDNLSGAVGFWIKIALGLIGVLFFILIFYAAFNWLTSQGEEEKIKQSQKTIVASVIGLVIIVSAYAITNTVSKVLIENESLQSKKEADGCCVDWVASDAIVPPIPACRIATYSSCKLAGENKTNTDVHAGPEGDKNWTWDPSIISQPACMTKCGS